MAHVLVGRVTPCAPQPASDLPNGAHGVTRPTALRNLFVSVLGILGRNTMAISGLRFTVSILASA